MRAVDRRLDVAVDRLARHGDLLEFVFYGYGDHQDLHSFPTRRSSDLERLCEQIVSEHDYDLAVLAQWDGRRDRKSTRLNSSHVSISYAVFCLKKKTRPRPAPPALDRHPDHRAARRGLCEMLVAPATSGRGTR